jgi:hypothetical protein
MFETDKPLSWQEVRHFVPGTMYGAPEHVPESAPGGLINFSAGMVELREDAMPAPLFGIYFGDGTSCAILDTKPRGNTTSAEFDSRLRPLPGSGESTILINENFLFGGMGGRESSSGKIEFGYWFPGTQGLFTGNHPKQAGHSMWRGHPIREGFEQQYELEFRFGDEERFHDFFKNAWRWAWDTLRPAVYQENIALVRRSLIDMLAEQVETHGGRTGLPNSINLARNPRTRDPKAIMGFTGKCLEAAVFLIMDAETDSRPVAAEHRKKGLAIIDSFLSIKVAPPEAEGFNMENGRPELALPNDKVVYLRSFTDDMKILLRGYKFEKGQRRPHPEWLNWCCEFGDWLLKQQQTLGGFPRAWAPGTGQVRLSAPQSSYNPVPFLVLLSELTGEPKYKEAAARAADFCWIVDQAHDRFIGGTIDNPNIIDKEAATLSTEAYLALFEATKGSKWLERAKASADFAETFVYIWNVPMAEDADDSQLHWKKGVPTIGLNVCSTGSPGGGDEYMAFDVDEYAKLYKYTGDRHYFEVARLLLHDTKNMLALPGKTFDLPGPGWQTENFSLVGPRRGRGGNYLWLPWVSTSHLNGILLTEEFDSDIFQELVKPPQEH